MVQWYIEPTSYPGLPCPKFILVPQPWSCIPLHCGTWLQPGACPCDEYGHFRRKQQTAVTTTKCEYEFKGSLRFHIERGEGRGRGWDHPPLELLNGYFFDTPAFLGPQMPPKATSGHVNFKPTWRNIPPHTPHGAWFHTHHSFHAHKNPV